MLLSIGSYTEYCLYIIISFPIGCQQSCLLSIGSNTVSITLSSYWRQQTCLLPIGSYTHYTLIHHHPLFLLTANKHAGLLPLHGLVFYWLPANMLTSYWLFDVLL